MTFILKMLGSPSVRELCRYFSWSYSVSPDKCRNATPSLHRFLARFQPITYYHPITLRCSLGKKDKVSVFAMSGNGGTAPFILNLGTRWSFTTHTSSPSPRKNTRYPLNRRLGGSQRRSGDVGGNSLSLAGNRSPDPPALSAVR
jgi:hypothetical protein